MLALRRSWRHGLRVGSWVGPHRTACACASEQAECAAPEPGSVSEYHAHVLVRLPAPEGAARHGAWWPKFVEKEPAIYEAFKALAQHQKDVSSTVKVTAFDDVGSRQPLEPGTCDVLAFPEGLRYRNVPMARLGDVVVRAVADDPSSLPPLPKDVVELQEEVREVMLFVCCHSARDARCGAVGPALAARLLALVKQHGLQDQIRVYKTSHVGGHKFAGNVLVYGTSHPCDGDWFGGVTADDAEEFLDGIIDIEFGADGGAEDTVLRQWWRGRMGLSKEEQLQLFGAGGGIEAVSDPEELSDGEDEEESEWSGQEEEEGPPPRRGGSGGPAGGGSRAGGGRQAGVLR